MAKKKTGKYAAVLATRPKFDPIPPERKDVVEMTKQRVLDATPAPDDPPMLMVMKDVDLLMLNITDIAIHATSGRRWASEFARVYAELRAIKDKLENWVSNVNLLVEVYQILMVDQLDVEGISSLKLANGQPIVTYEEPYTQVTDREAFRVWCLAEGFERKMMLPWSTANAHVKKMLINGEPEPPGVTVYGKTVVRLGGDPTAED